MLIVFLLLIALIIGFLWNTSSKETPKKAEARDEVTKLQTQIATIKKEQEDYSVEKVTKKLVDNSIDLNAAITEVKQKLTIGFDLAYNHTKSEADYKILETKLPALFGSELSEKVLSLSEPIISQAGEPQISFDKITKETLSFGTYNNLTHSIGVLVIINYQSPSLVGSDIKVEGQDLYELNYDIKNKVLSLKNYDRILKGAEDK